MRSRSVTLLAALAALVLPLLALAPAAHADDPIPTTTTLTIYSGDHVGSTMSVQARVTRAGGYGVGTVTFIGIGDGQPIPVDEIGLATLNTTAPSNAPIQITAQFTGAPGYADSSDTETSRTLFLPYWQPEPTIAKLGAGGKLTLTLATRVVNYLGAPQVGFPIYFTLVAPTPSIFQTNTGSVSVCKTVTDATGFATCKGTGTIASLLSILTGAYASYVVAPSAFGPLDSVKLPVIVS